MMNTKGNPSQEKKRIIQELKQNEGEGSGNGSRKQIWFVKCSLLSNERKEAKKGNQFHAPSLIRFKWIFNNWVFIWYWLPIGVTATDTDRGPTQPGVMRGGGQEPDVCQVWIRVILGRQGLFTWPSMREKFPFLWVSPLHSSILKPNLHLKRRRENEEGLRVSISEAEWNNCNN